MTDQCRDQQLGRLLPEYELGLLDREQQEGFEQHLMACEYCFEQVRQFTPAASKLRTAPYRDMVTVADPDVRQPSLGVRLVTWLWPKGGPWLKPAVALVLIVLLLPLAWDGLQDNGAAPGTVSQAKEIALVRSRSVSSFPEIAVPHEADLVVTFGFEPEDPTQPLSIRLLGPDQAELYAGDSFELDRQLTGRLTIPSARVTVGEYLLVIRDPIATGPLAVDSLRFRVINAVEE